MPPKPKPSKTVIILALLALAGLIVLGSMAIRAYSGLQRKAETGRGTRTLGDARQLLFALRDYNRDLGTDTSPYPSDIHELEARGYIENVGNALAVDDNPSGDWLYFSAADSTDSAAPLLISPLHSGKHIVLRVDGSASDLTAQEVADFIAKAAIPPQRIPVIRRAPASK